jgi:hypothetical protein
MKALILLALILLQPCAQAAEVGRLFFTPEQRAQMDYQYARNVTAEGDTGSVLTVNGIVQRSGGHRTVWINGVPQAAGKSDDRSPASVPVTVPGRAKSVEIKVGQRLLLEAPAPAVTGK